MTTTPLSRRFAALLAHNANTTQTTEAFSGQDEEPEATRRDRKIAAEPLAPTQRAKASRRRYSDQEKRRILRLVDACTERGQIGAILRREGIYYSTLRLFLEQREKGRLDMPSRPENNKQTNKQALQQQLAQLQRQNQRLADKLEKAEIVLDFQKKLSRLLEIETQQTQENF